MAGAWFGRPAAALTPPGLLCPQKCERCGRAGATIPCRAAAGCSRLYHFPCAAASGCFQSMKTLRLLCPEHVAEAVDTGAWGWGHHPWVLGPSCPGEGSQRGRTPRVGSPDPILSRLAEDARCSVCKGPGDLRDLVFCTGCGQHFHGACLDISLTPRKRSGWQCPECKVCQTCR